MSTGSLGQSSVGLNSEGKKGNKQYPQTSKNLFRKTIQAVVIYSLNSFSRKALWKSPRKQQESYTKRRNVKVSTNIYPELCVPD